MRRKKATTIFIRIFIPLFLVMLLQSGIFYLVTVCGDTVKSLDSNAVDILSERVDNHQNEISTMLVSKWGNFSAYGTAINELYTQYQADFTDPLYSDIPQKRSFLLDASEVLFKMIRANEVNGVYIILTNSDSYVPLGENTQTYYGLCIRDYDATSAYTDKEDLIISKCPSSLTTKLGCPLDSYWEATYNFAASAQNGDFFYKPLKEAYSNPGIASDNFTYFCSNATYSKSERPLVSYSIPLISPDGVIYGVLGVEVLTSYISSLLPKNDLLLSGNASYMLVQYNAGDYDFNVITVSGTYYQQSFGDSLSLSLNPENRVMNNPKLIECKGTRNQSICCYISPMKIYNDNTPFESDTLAIISLTPKDELFSVSDQVKKSLLFVSVLILLIGVLGIFVVSHLLTLPVQRLASEVANVKTGDMNLTHINIVEIDRLVDAIVDQSKKIDQAKVRTEFLSRMSHDMRTPMNAIIGFSSPQILSGCDNQDLLDNLKKIHESGEYLLGLINEVLDMTKIDSGKMELQCAAFELNGLWTSVTPMIDEFAAKKNVNFEKDLPDLTDSAVTVMGDVQRLSQIVVNLLSNAVKFTPKNGTVVLSATENFMDIEHVALTIRVKDSGIGMSADFQKKLYEPFVQEHPNKEGTGLGLSIVYQLVTLMGGTIKCESEQGKGTEFIVHIILPIASETEKTENTETEQFDTDKAKASLEGKRILLCEDQPLNQQIACRLLKQYDMIVDVAEDGSVGVEMFTRSATAYYDAILMDIRMPVMDGLEATRAIRKLERSDAKTIPIIAMTANAFTEDRATSAEAGMNEHLAKPIDPSVLYMTLYKYLSLDK